MLKFRYVIGGLVSRHTGFLPGCPLALCFLLTAMTACSPRGGGAAGGGETEDGPAGDGNQDEEPAGNGNDSDIPTVSDLVEVPDPLSAANPDFPTENVELPEPDEMVIDSRLGTGQVRVVHGEGLRHEYSRFDPFNRDQSMILLQAVAQGEWRVYRADDVPYDRDGSLVRTIDLEEPRWDRQEENILWGLRDFSILTVDVQSGAYTTIKDFRQDGQIGSLLQDNPEVYRITTRAEGESSIDQRYWAFFLQGDERVDYRSRFLFTWDRNEDRVLGVYQLAEEETRIDWVGMSPLGTWVVLGGDFDNAGDIGPGLVIANRELTEFYMLFPASAHGDVGLDGSGREVFVQQNTPGDTIDLIPLEAGGQPVELIRLFYDSESAMGLNSGVHISCNCPGYCVVSTYIEPDLPEQNWLDRSIVLVQLDRDDPGVFYLAKVYGTTASYWEETQAAITNDGSKVIWATNWGEHVGQERVWDMLLEIARLATTDTRSAR